MNSKELKQLENQILKTFKKLHNASNEQEKILHRNELEKLMSEKSKYDNLKEVF